MSNKRKLKKQRDPLAHLSNRDKVLYHIAHAVIAENWPNGEPFTAQEVTDRVNEFIAALNALDTGAEE